MKLSDVSATNELSTTRVAGCYATSGYLRFNSFEASVASARSTDTSVCARCEPMTTTAVAGCVASCSGWSCDTLYVVLPYSCAYLEDEYGCDCSGCGCAHESTTTTALPMMLLDAYKGVGLAD